MTTINWTKIDTVLLDMDGTLLDLHYDNYFWSSYLPQRYAEIKNLPLDETRQLLLTIDICLLKQEIKGKIKERPYTKAFLQFLQAKNKNVALVTNAHPIGLELKLAETCIGNYLDNIISSHQFQQPKETQAFWELLEQHMPFDVKRTLFIDDNAAILHSAKTYGIAYTLGIHQPDSRIERTLEDVMAIHHFDEIMPRERTL